MPNIQVFVEDELNQAYEILAAKAIAATLPNSPTSGRPRIRAAKMMLNELTRFENLLDMAQRSQRSGYQQVVFVIDHEGPAADSGRVKARRRFREAFQALCDYGECLPPGDSLKQLKLVRVEVRSCLESWLLSDPQAIVETFGGPPSYRPRSQQTEHLTPRQTRDRIAHIVQEIGKRKNNQRLARMQGRAMKSLGKKIAHNIELARARHFNASLDYFCDMVENYRDGCQHPFPESS